MDFLQPRSLEEALSIKAARPEALPIAGGTDVMVELNFGRRRPEALLDLGRIEELAGWQRDGETVRVGATVTYREVLTTLWDALPGLALASRTVGSTQIRSRGTIGGNLGTASPAGDLLPPLLATGARVEVASLARRRVVRIEEFFAGPKRSVLDPDELITAVELPVATGPQQFSKVGGRNAMTIAVASFAIALSPLSQRVGTGLGSVAPTPRRARRAESFLESELRTCGFWDRGASISPSAARQFAELVAADVQPVDDVRGTAAYRRHAVTVLASRSLEWACEDHLNRRRSAT